MWTPGSWWLYASVKHRELVFYWDAGDQQGGVLGGVLRVCCLESCRLDDSRGAYSASWESCRF